MASAFNLTAQINLRGPSNLRPVVSQIRRQLGSIDSNINLKIDNKASKSIDIVTNRLGSMNKVLIEARNNTVSLNQSLRDLSSSLGSIQTAGNSAAGGVKRTSQSVEKVAKDIKIARTEIEEFGRQSALAVRRFAAFSAPTIAIFALTNAITSAFKAFIDFDRELIKLQQVTGRGAIGVKILQDEITNLAKSLGVSSASLIEVASTLAQAGLNIEETRVALKALAKTELAPSFENLTKTTEGAIAAIRQFGLEAGELEGALGSINAVAAAFAVESGDIIAAIQRTGGVFASASKGVSEGSDALNEFVAIFTSVRQTTRESAETIATGLRTIFTRIQRAGTIKQLREFGVELQDLEGKFVGPFEAVRRLSEALNQLDPRDIRFSTIVEELGGFRQIGKVIPLIQQFAVAQQALGVAQRGQSSLSDAQVKAQQSLANQIGKVREQFLALIRDVGQSTVFQGFFKIVLGLTSGLISLASAFKPILPILAVFGAIKGVSAIGQFATGFFGGLKKGGGAGGAGKNIGESLSGAKEKQRAEATSKAADAIRLNTDALKSLTSSVQSLDSTIKSRGSTTLAFGGKILGFNTGGIVPGSGKGDKVPALLEPGEVVINNKAANKYGRGNLVRMNKYAEGGTTKYSDKYYGMLIPTTNNPPDKTGVKYQDPQTQNTYVGNIRKSGFAKSDKFNELVEPSIHKEFDNIHKKLAQSINRTSLIPSIEDKAKRASRTAQGFMFENYVLSAARSKDPGKRAFDIIKPGKIIKQLTDQSISGLTDIKLSDSEQQESSIIAKASRARPQDFKNIGGKIQKFPVGGMVGRVPMKKSIDDDRASAVYDNTRNKEVEGSVYAPRIGPDLYAVDTAGVSKPGQGYGVPLYDAVLQQVSAKKAWLTSSRTQVSEQARSIWDGYRKKRPDVKNKLLPMEQWNMDPLFNGQIEGEPLNDLAYQFPENLNDLKKHKKTWPQKDHPVWSLQHAYQLKAKAIKKFMAGSVGGVMEQTEEALPSDIAGLIAEIEKIGGTTQLYDFVPKSEIESILKEKKVFPRPTAKQLVSSPWLTAKTPDLYGDRGKYIEPLQEVIRRARPRFNAKQSGIQAQLLRNVQAASGQGYKFGLASIYGPNGELGYSSTSNAQEIKGPDGTKYLTQIIRKSLPERYLDAIRATSQDIAGVPARAAERLQYADIFGTGGPLAFDFDETLVKGSDIPGKNPADYSDLNKVEEALKNAELTLLGQELQKRINQYPELLDSIRVLTARPKSNAQYLASTLARLGLPIPETKITGVSGGLNKVNNLSELETLIDDNLENVQSVMAGGKRAILYSEPLQTDASSRSIQVMEGYALEEMVKSLGVKISPDDADPLRPIDYPNGLGAYARYWDLPPNIPTDTKRTNSSSALNRLFDEAERFYAKNFAFGGKTDGPSFDEVRQKIIDKYPDIQFRISKRTRGFGYNLMGALKSKGGLSGDSGLNFQQPGNLKQLQEYSDKLAAKLMSPEQLAVGGLLKTYEAGSVGGVEEADPLLDKLRKKKESGVFGKVGLRSSASEVTATYFKNATRSGMVTAKKLAGNIFSIGLSNATGGFGPYLYEVVMEKVTQLGSMLTPDRAMVSKDAQGFWQKAFGRSSIKKTPLPVEYWSSNSKLLDPKLYGKPETWPPPTDPAWILQSGYSKSPEFINSSDVIDMNDPKYKAFMQQQQLQFLSRPIEQKPEPSLADFNPPGTYNATRGITYSTGGTIKRFASGGTVPAMVSNGEAFVPPKLAKKIGYAKLDKMNQADRNGMKGFAAGGGVSVFKGPGSGTSDSIGPIGLPQGSYVIREKATKALGLNKGGGVGIQRFETGGRLSKAERKKIKEQYLAEQRGGITRDEARFVGAPRPDFGAGASRKRDATATPQGVENIKKVETEVLNNTKKLYAEQKKKIDQLYDNLQSQAREEFFSGTIDADEFTDSLLALFEARILAKGQAKETLTAQLPAAQAKAAEEFKVGKQTTQIEERKGESAKYFEAQVKSKMDAVAAEVKQKYQDLLNQEVQSLKAFYTERAKQVKAEGGDVSAVIAEYQAAVADAKQSLEAGKRAATTQAQAAVPEQIATSKREAVEAKRLDDTERARVKAETAARAADPFYDAKKAADVSAAGVFGMPKVNPKIAEEQNKYMQMRAEQAGLSVGGYKYSLAQKLGQNRFNVEREMTLARADTQTMVTGRRRELAGVNVSGALKAAEAGDTSQEVQRVQSVISDFTNQLQKANPALTFQQARDAAIDLATKVSEGTQSFSEIVEGNKTLKESLSDTIDANAVLAESFRRTSVDTGESIENLKANVSNRQIEQQAFIQSREGQRMGAFASIAPDLAKGIANSKIGKALGGATDFVQGKGGAFSKGFASVGGFAGIGGGLAVGAEALKQFLPKSVTSDPNTAGALGALGGAGAGAAMGATLLQGLPFGEVIGGIGGAIIGGIQGFFNAKNQAILTNAIENVAKTTGQLDIAFKKLEADTNAVNLGNAQKAFGEVIGAQQDIRNMAFTSPTLTGSDAMSIGGTALAGAGTGAAAGAIIGSMVPILGTAIGAAVGGAIGGLGGAAYAYFNRPSQAQREEALGATIQQSGANQEAATRLAEGQLKMTSTEDIDKILKGLNDGISGLNPIVQQYATGMAAATGKTVEQVKAQAEEQAALDAFMKLRKEAGATDEQIGKELEKDRKGAIAVGKEALQANAQLLLKQQLLARATKEVAVATESLLDVYRRINAEAERYSSELEQFGADIDALVGGLGGDTSMRAVNRQNEQVLGNVSAYSTEEVRAAANASAGLLGGTPQAQNLANQAVAQKVIQDQIPALLRNATTPEAQDAAIEQIRGLLEEQGLGGAAIDTVLTDLSNRITEGVKSGTGTSETDLQEQVERSFSTVGKGLEALQNVTKKYNDTLQQARKFQADYNKAVLEAGSYLRKATQVRLNAELDLAKALGRSPTLEELNKPFDVEVASLTGRLVESGDLAAGAASDPMAIAAAISSAERRKQEIEQGAPELLGAAANIPGGPAGDPLRQELNQAQLDNIRAIGDLTIASAEGRQALEKLANDGTKAANALAKIQEEQQALEGFAAFAQNVFTAEPQQLAQMELQATALNAAQASGPEFMQSRYNRQQAFAGLEQEKQFLTPQEYRDAQADLLRKSFEAQGKRGGDVVRKIGGKEFTLDQFIERVRGGVDQTDPNVVAFREASEVQAKANEALGKLNMEQAFIIQDAMLRLEFFLSSDFPQILTNAVTNAEADAQTKPEVKPETKPKGPSYNEQRLDEGKKKEAEGRRLLAEAKKEEDALGYWAGSSEVGAVNTKKRKAREMIAAGQQTVATYGPKAEADAAARAQQEAAATEAKKQAETEAKARQTEENKAKAEEAIDKAREAREGGRPVMVGSGGQTVTAAYTGSYTPRTQEEVRALADEVTEARFSGTRPPIQAPPAPGTGAQQATAQAVAPTADPITQAIRQAQAAEASGEIERLGTSQTSKEKDIAKLEARAKAERIAAKAAGTYTGPTKSEAALASAQQDLASINEQITAEKQRLAALAEQARLEAQGTQPTTGVVTTPPTGTPIPLGGMASTVEPAQSAYDNRGPQTPNALLPRTAPVPVTMPQQASYTNQQAVSTTGERVEDKKMAREAQAITIDSASLESLNAFNTTFGSYVDKLVTFEFPTIPDVIEMKGNHVVDVRISGAAAFEGLKKDFETMMQKEIRKAMGRIWGQSNGQMGERPSGTESPP